MRVAALLQERDLTKCTDATSRGRDALSKDAVESLGSVPSETKRKAPCYHVGWIKAVLEGRTHPTVRDKRKLSFGGGRNAGCPGRGTPEDDLLEQPVILMPEFATPTRAPRSFLARRRQ